MRVNLILADNIIIGYTQNLNNNLPIIDIEDPEKLNLGLDLFQDGQIISKVEEANEKLVRNTKNNRIQELKNLLTKSDYQAIKFAEGELTEEEYAPIKSQRKEWRAEINKLEGELK